MSHTIRKTDELACEQILIADGLSFSLYISLQRSPFKRFIVCLAEKFKRTSIRCFL